MDRQRALDSFILPHSPKVMLTDTPAKEHGSIPKSTNDTADSGSASSLDGSFTASQIVEMLGRVQSPVINILPPAEAVISRLPERRRGSALTKVGIGLGVIALATGAGYVGVQVGIRSTTLNQTEAGPTTTHTANTSPASNAFIQNASTGEAADNTGGIFKSSVEVAEPRMIEAHNEDGSLNPDGLTWGNGETRYSFDLLDTGERADTSCGILYGASYAVTATNPNGNLDADAITSSLENLHPAEQVQLVNSLYADNVDFAKAYAQTLILFIDPVTNSEIAHMSGCAEAEGDK